MNETEKQSAIEVLNKIMELELAGVVRYTHYSLMVFGYNRIPIVSWLKGNADESLAHANKAGEFVTMLGGHPSLKIGPLLETQSTTSATFFAKVSSRKARRSRPITSCCSCPRASRFRLRNMPAK